MAYMYAYYIIIDTQGFTMKKITVILGFIGLTIFISGCSTVPTTLLPQGNNIYVVIATSSSSSRALNGAMKKANETCHARHQSAIVLSHESVYQGGMDQSAKETLTMATQIVNMNSNAYVPGPNNSANFKVDLKFKCE